MGHIRWKTLPVSQAMDQVEEILEPIYEPLRTALPVVKELKKNPDYPQYLTQSLSALEGEIDRILGYTSWSGDLRPGAIGSAIERVRSELPKDHLEHEKKRASVGETQALIG